MARSAVTRVGEVMTRAVVCAHDGADFKEIAAAMARNRVSTVPVLDEARRVIGVVTASDLLARVSGDRGAPPRGHRLAAAHESHRKSRASHAAQLMTAPAITTTEDTEIEEAARLAAHFHVRCMPVVDADGVIAGMVSRSDLVKIFLRHDEDIREEAEFLTRQGDLRLDASGVDIRVDEGVVTLTGRVERRTQAEQLATAIHGVSGVVEVENQLSFRNDDTIHGPWAWSG